jgi:hypothetical protein
MARHGKQVRYHRKEDDNLYDVKLNDCITYIENKCPEQWNFILAYVDAESTIPKNRFNKMVTDNQLAREAFYRQGKADVFARLARLKEQEDVSL